MASEFRTPNQMRRNPLTHLAHRREVFWQITAPLVVGGLVILAAAGGVVWAGASGAGDLPGWADISTVWLIVPAMFFSLVFLVLLLGIIYGVTWLLGRLPGWFLQVQDIFLLIKFRLLTLNDKAVEPVLRTRQSQAAVQALLRALQRGRRADVENR